MEYVKNNEIVLNIGFEATSALQLGNDAIEFKARFGGQPREIRVPIDHVVAIYARENGQGMAFPVPTEGKAADAPAEAGPVRGLRLATTEPDTGSQSRPEPPPHDDPPEPAPPGGGRPSLKRVK
jgi:stringent starvation protein B